MGGSVRTNLRFIAWIAIAKARYRASALLARVARALGWRRDPNDTDGDGQFG